MDIVMPLIYLQYVGFRNLRLTGHLVLKLAFSVGYELIRAALLQQHNNTRERTHSLYVRLYVRAGTMILATRGANGSV